MDTFSAWRIITRAARHDAAPLCCTSRARTPDCYVFKQTLVWTFIHGWERQTGRKRNKRRKEKEEKGCHAATNILSQRRHRIAQTCLPFAGCRSSRVTLTRHYAGARRVGIGALFQSHFSTCAHYRGSAHAAPNASRRRTPSCRAPALWAPLPSITAFDSAWLTITKPFHAPFSARGICSLGVACRRSSHRSWRRGHRLSSSSSCRARVADSSNGQPFSLCHILLLALRLPLAGINLLFHRLRADQRMAADSAAYTRGA